MKNILLFTATIALSTYTFAGNVSPDENMKATHDQSKGKGSLENILNNDEMKRLHKRMTRYSMSEPGMEARVEMITTEVGRAYHKALEKAEKNTAG
ncbi:hypothetical protein RE428_31040 [Marinobacter nanhaiticus D15-8W]|jgi:hypothetical protein|uniref:DUF4148 domain-containing protein n=3 Tax=Marinobacter TaxID=2742 RepID=N6X0E0_9GAMM|nr:MULTISPECIES: hypothetical protein [Marinobacter]ENO17221.1 hypothetical protein J057_00170 [Marinobacter nanhaiticus D15-8W]MBW4979931.1 hypothetical protein [Marinobacter adhaerens]QWV13962.1 hypothetical protein KQ249_04935 [Marinobacter adhaerens]BES72086.1 hypothetical protein RE428_31040 [Marinobacter nanhaiticus D15-8W]